MSRKRKPRNKQEPRFYTPKQSVRRMDWFDDEKPAVGKKCKICDELFYYNLDTEIFCPICKRTLKRLVIQNINIK